MGNVTKRIKLLKEQIHNLGNVERNGVVIVNETRLSAKLDEWLAREELLWKQRSRMDWLKAGDRNTTFYKMKATQRKTKKFIKFIKRVDGSVVSEHQEIIDEFSIFYKELFQVRYDQQDIDWSCELQDITFRVPDELNDRLQESYTMEEISRALFQMHPDKALGIDDFSTLFYQKFWSVIKRDVLDEMMLFLNTGVLDRRLNETIIVLVPKGKDP